MQIAWKFAQGTGSRSSQLLLGDRLFLVGDNARFVPDLWERER